nr:MAG TPA: hypothetical protein [Caudoviricetes sp.]
MIPLPTFSPVLAGPRRCLLPSELAPPAAIPSALPPGFAPIRAARPLSGTACKFPRGSLRVPGIVAGQSRNSRRIVVR